MIRVEGLTAVIKKTTILRDVSLSVSGGEFVAVVGPNGAGKTTLLKHLNGLIKPTSGTVSIDGLDTRKTATSVLARSVGFLFQNPDRQILCASVREEIRFGLKHCGVPKDEWDDRVAEAARLAGLSGKLDADPLMLTRSRRQRVALASVLATKPRILVLDEPTSAQDESETERVMAAARGICERGGTVLLVTHDMELVARHASRVIAIVEGEVARDAPPEEFFSDVGFLSRARLSEPSVFALARKLSLDLRSLGPDPFADPLPAFADMIESRAGKAAV